MNCVSFVCCRFVMVRFNCFAHSAKELHSAVDFAWFDYPAGLITALDKAHYVGLYNDGSVSHR